MAEPDDTAAGEHGHGQEQGHGRPREHGREHGRDAGRAQGILPSQALRAAIAAGELAAQVPIAEDQVQPASVDLRLGEVAWRVPASFLTGPRGTVEERLALYGMHRIDLTGGAVLERGCVYIVPLLERARLAPRTSALGNPKSSTGRLDVFARLIVDRGIEFDRVPAGYQGPLYAEVAPRTFSVLVRTGARLVQLRLRHGSAAISDTALKRLSTQVGLFGGDARIERGLAFTVDTEGAGEGDIVGYRARKHAGLIDVDLVDHYDPDDFWEPVVNRRGRPIILNPDDFYILASKETVAVPTDHAAEMLAYDTFVGEFRVHYAGFFDPGFGLVETGGAGSRAVLEVRSHDVPFMLEHGQVVGRLVYERLTAAADKLYGRDIGSTYQRQTLRLGKQFRQPA